MLWTIGIDQQAADRRDPGLVWAAWRAAAEEVWATSAELRRASADEREAAYAQLYLSHRTVGSHLYRTFPKLGIPTPA